MIKNLLLQLKTNIINPNPEQKIYIAARCYVWIIFFMYILLPTDNGINNSYFKKEILYGIMTIFMLVLYLFFIITKKISLIKSVNNVDIFVFFLSMIMCVFRIKNVNHYDYNPSVNFYLCIIGTYFVIRISKLKYKDYLSLFLISSFILYLIMFAYYISEVEIILGIKDMFNQIEDTASLLILSAGISCIFYCFENKFYKKQIYLVTADFSFFMIYILNDIVSIYIIGVFLLIIPLLFLPTITLIKNNLTLIFNFLYIFSCITFINYIGKINNFTQFKLQYGIYMDLFLLLLGVGIFIYWNRVPKKMNPDYVIMKKFKDYYKIALYVSGIVFVSCMVIGKRIQEIPITMGIQTLKVFVISLIQSINKNEGVIEQLLKDWGITGVILWIYLIVLLIEYTKRKWKKGNLKSKNLLLLSGLFVVQSFFYKLQYTSTPIYVMIVAFSLTSNSDDNK